MKMRIKARRLSAVVVALVGVVIWLIANPASYDVSLVKVENTGAEGGVSSNEERGLLSNSNGVGLNDGTPNDGSKKLAIQALEELEVKGRAPKTGYSRDQFYNGWPTVEGCSLRQRIIKREFGDTAVLDGCNVVAGEYDEPYTGEHMVFKERADISSGVQIDHVVALSDAWQKGAQNKTPEIRYEIATDPLNLLAVDASANGKKSDGDAATWLPSNKKFRCQYVARQVSVKHKYVLWVTEAEKEAIRNVLSNCPNEPLVL